MFRHTYRQYINFYVNLRFYHQNTQTNSKIWTFQIFSDLHVLKPYNICISMHRGDRMSIWPNQFGWTPSWNWNSINFWTETSCTSLKTEPKWKSPVNSVQFIDWLKFVIKKILCIVYTDCYSRIRAFLLTIKDRDPEISKIPKWMNINL